MISTQNRFESLIKNLEHNSPERLETQDRELIEEFFRKLSELPFETCISIWSEHDDSYDVMLYFDETKALITLKCHDKSGQPIIEFDIRNRNNFDIISTEFEDEEECLERGVLRISELHSLNKKVR